MKTIKLVGNITSKKYIEKLTIEMACLPSKEDKVKSSVGIILLDFSKPEKK